MIHLCHFIFAVPDLEKARLDFEKQAGVLPQLGGQHPNLGTHNALVSLGNSYFELLAQDPTLEVEENPILKRVQHLHEPTFFAWALRCEDFQSVSERLEAHGLELSKTYFGSRRTLSGALLNFEFGDIEGLQDSPTNPFFVRWIDSVHPSLSAPQGIDLEKVSVATTDPKLRRFLKSLDLGLELLEGESSLRLDLRAPTGSLALS